MPTVIHTPQSRCRWGGARCDITPPIGIYHRMWGAASHDYCTGIHRRLTATAMVFQSLDAEPSAETEQVLLAIDHCILWQPEMDRLLAAVEAGSGVPREQIVVTFSHTHSAGLMDPERASLPGGSLIAPYLEELGSRLAAIVRQARDSVQPATIAYGFGRCSLAGQRDFWDEKSGQFVCGLNPAASADDTLLVGRVTDAAGVLLATIVNYACHPTTLAWENTLISPDYPGAMREVVERTTGAPCVFLQGASGDLGPREGYVGDPEIADRNGRMLGYAALSSLEALPAPGKQFEYAGPVVSGATLGAWVHRPLSMIEAAPLWHFRLRRFTVDLARRTDLEHTGEETGAGVATELMADADARAMEERRRRQRARLAALPEGANYPFPVTLCQIGDGYWLTVEGEPYNVLQRALRGRFPGVPIVVSVLANGARSSYLPPAGVYGRGIYQESVAVLAAGSLEKLIDAVSAQIAAWQTDWPALKEQRIDAARQTLLSAGAARAQGLPLSAEGAAADDLSFAAERSENATGGPAATIATGFPDDYVD